MINVKRSLDKRPPHNKTTAVYVLQPQVYLISSSSSTKNCSWTPDRSSWSVAWLLRVIKV